MRRAPQPPRRSLSTRRQSLRRRHGQLAGSALPRAFRIGQDGSGDRRSRHRPVGLLNHRYRSDRPDSQFALWNRADGRCGQRHGCELRMAGGFRAHQPGALFSEAFYQRHERNQSARRRQLPQHRRHRRQRQRIQRASRRRRGSHRPGDDRGHREPAHSNLQRGRVHQQRRHPAHQRHFGPEPAHRHLPLRHRDSGSPIQASTESLTSAGQPACLKNNAHPMPAWLPSGRFRRSSIRISICWSPTRTTGCCFAPQMVVESAASSPLGAEFPGMLASLWPAVTTNMIATGTAAESRYRSPPLSPIPRFW